MIFYYPWLSWGWAMILLVFCTKILIASLLIMGPSHPRIFEIWCFAYHPLRRYFCSFCSNRFRLLALLWNIPLCLPGSADANAGLRIMLIVNSVHTLDLCMWRAPPGHSWRGSLFLVFFPSLIVPTLPPVTRPYHSLVLHAGDQGCWLLLSLSSLGKAQWTLHSCHYF